MESAEYKAMFQVEHTHWWFASRRLFIQKILRGLNYPNGTSLRIADIGAGTGGMIDFLKRYGRVVGIEPSGIGRKLAKKRGGMLRRGKAERTGLASNSFDMVCLLDVLYHRDIDQKKALEEAWRILKSGGLLLVTDAAMPWLYSGNDKAVHGARRYTISSVSKVLSAAGFTQVRATYTFFFLFPIFTLWRLLPRFFASKKYTSDVHPVPWALNGALRVVCAIEAACLPVISYPWGSSVLVVARKS